MVKIKIYIDFSTNRYSDSELLVKTASIETALLGNPRFAAAAGKLTVVTEKKEIFALALSKAATGTKQDTYDKNIARKPLESALGDLGLNVQEISGGDESLLLESGFDLKKKRSSVGELDPVKNLEVKAGTGHGVLELSWNVVEHALVYNLEYCEAPSSGTSVWVRISVSKRRFTIKDLTPGKAYVFRVAAVGTTTDLNWSEEVTSFVM